MLWYCIGELLRGEELVAMQDKASFQLRFCGSAVEDGGMDVAQLAPALLSIGNLIKIANTEINGRESAVSIKIEAFKKGSFGIDFAVFTNGVHSVLKFFGSVEICGAMNLLATLGIVGGSGLITLIKWIKGRRIRSVRENDETAIFTLENGDTKEVKRNVLVLYRNVDVRQGLEDSLSVPLTNKGIDSIEISNDIEETIVIGKNESEFFRAPELESSELDESIYEVWVQPINVAFKENNKWRFSDGQFTFYASMSDKTFMDKVNDDLAIAAGDMFKVKIKRTQRESAQGLSTDYEVLHVLEHRQAGKQLPLPMEK